MHERDCCFGLPLELFETVSNQQTLQEEQSERGSVVLPPTQVFTSTRKALPVVQPLVPRIENRHD
jgi:hypothetical protein